MNNVLWINVNIISRHTGIRCLMSLDGKMHTNCFENAKALLFFRRDRTLGPEMMASNVY